MRFTMTIVINIIDVFCIYLLYHGFTQKRASFRFRRTMILTVCGILLGVGFHYINTDIMKMIYYLLWFIIVFKASNFEWSSSFLLFVLNLIVAFFLQIITTVITLLPIKDYNMVLFGQLLYLILIIFVYWKIPISKLVRLTEQNVVIKFMFFFICAGLFVSLIILGFNKHNVSPYILYYIVAVFFSGLGIYETAVIIRKYTSEIPARYHEHDNIIAGLVSLYMTYGNDELRETLSDFLEDYGKKEYVDKLSVTLDSENDFLSVFLQLKKSNALRKGIELTWDSTYIENKRVSKTDTIKIIGILLDNAIEHCDRGQEIFLKIFITEYNFDVEVKNPYKGSAEDIGHMFSKGSSSKKESLGGHGLNNLWKIVNRLNGKVMVDPFDGSITFKVVI